MSGSAHVYVKRRENGQYSVKVGDNDRASGLFWTQADAVGAARRMCPQVKPDIECQPNTTRGTSGQWRA
jgi:hypothetical protein